MTLADRFKTAAGSPPPTEEQRAQVAANADAILAAADVIDAAPDSRHKSLALTHLEEALMWANKGVFAPARPGTQTSPAGGPVVTVAPGLSPLPSPSAVSAVLARRNGQRRSLA
ncbi:hypothetical protein A9Z40_03075 [Microbacterium arborescens]|uniref:Acb2/Tad1 hairpin domain-containing protein n=1 Tax=Microbacterium arborescens TaxID=33883 RepID=A0ABX2WIB3_9MICO|nr:hypothetical protein [Microbacterium arborescens]OAZ40938.1 hypothetical protein A9Z40_03075 [Microbacterium arborescens]